MNTELLLLASSTLLAEDLACIGAGALVASGQLGFIEAAIACTGGIVAGDLALYGCGRVLGRRVLRWRLVNRRVTAAQLDRASEWLSRRGAWVIFASRFTPGMRLPVYLAAGALRTNALRFAGWFVLASSAWTPLLVGASAVFGAQAASIGLSSAASIPAAAALMGGCMVGLRYATTRLIPWQRRRRILGRVRRCLRWEFWPVWAACLPLVPWILALAIRYRSLTVFTAANPGIETGGLVGESKSRILKGLAPSGAVAPFVTVDRNSPPPDVDSFPVVLKPDVGERGSGVVIAHSRPDLETALAKTRGKAILQKYIPGLEFGVFYRRYPHEVRGRITSVTRKLFPAVTGDGQRTLRELILADDRAVCMASVYFERNAGRLDSTPADGLVVPLVEIGSHCRGAVFADAAYLVTEELERRIDDVSRTHPGFFFGRYDIRAASVDAFQSGDFTVIELNGVAAEPIHIYDPAVTLFAAYRAMFRHWLDAFRIGSMNCERGARPTTICELVRILRGR